MFGQGRAICFLQECYYLSRVAIESGWGYDLVKAFYEITEAVYLHSI